MSYFLDIFKTILSNLIFLILYVPSGFIKKNKKRWGFGSLAGQEFRGNSKYLYNYLKESHKDLELFWIAKSKKQNKILREKGINSFYAYSLKGILKICTSSVIFLTHGLVDTIICVSKNTKLVQLGHMTFTIKENSLVKRLEKKNFLSKIYGKFLYSNLFLRKIDVGVFSSEFSYNNLFTNDKWFPSKKLISGLPKTDNLLKLKTKLNNSPKQRTLFDQTVNQDEKLVLYIPTRRENKLFNIFDYDFSSKKFEEFTAKNKCIFFVSNHPTNPSKNIYNEHIRNLNFVNLNGNIIDEILSKADIIITDFSSIFADFLLFDKPIIFSKFDYNNYVKSSGLKIDYNSLPGPKVKNWDELLAEIDTFLNSDDNYKNQREDWKKKVYNYLDGKNSERIANYFKQ